MQTGLPPWHMWGNTLTTTVVATAAAPFAKFDTQLLRINYGRPETWRFLFQVQIIDGNTAGGGGDLIVDFVVTCGVGRTSFTIQPAPRFQFTWAAAVPINSQIFSSTIDGPVKDAAFPNRPNVLDTLSAQDIQVTVGGIFTPNSIDQPTPPTVTFNASALFTPNVHVRPEWHDGKYPGGETQGR